MIRGFDNLREELRNEVRELELEIVRLGERLAEKSRLLTRLEVDTGESRPPPLTPLRGNGIRSITALPIDHYEVDGQRFRNAGHVLDYFNAPHYFSKKNPGKKDQATREIIRWARRNPSEARTVTVVFRDGTSSDLYTAVMNAA